MPLPFSWFLVIDDEATVREMLAAFLGGGPRVLKASCANEALAALPGAPEVEPGCALVDFKMPGADGLATIALLRRLRPGLPCALVTGSDIPDRVALAGGAGSVLRKPFRMGELEACLDSLAARV
jgi:two-component system, LuxR family, response regulator FixJ